MVVQSKCVVALKIVAVGCWYSGHIVNTSVISSFHRLVVSGQREFLGIGLPSRSLGILPNLNM